MAETTIEWTSTRAADGAVHAGYSFNAWVGCQEVSVGPQGACERC
jgi:alpha/beta superfamily hydrolase